MNGHVYGEMLNRNGLFAAGFRPLTVSNGADISGDAVLSSLLEYVVAAAREVFDASGVSLMLLNQGEELVVRVSTGIPADIVTNTRRKLGEGISGWVAKKVTPLLLNGPVMNDPRFEGVDSTITSALSVPLAVKGRAVGVLNLSTRKTGRMYSQHDLEIASLIAAALAAAIESLSTAKRVEEDSKQVFMLFELGRALNGASTVSETLDIAASMFRDFTASDICMVLELQDGDWVLRAVDGLDEIAETEIRMAGKENGLLERCLIGGSPLLASRVELDGEDADWIPHETMNFLIAPLLSSKRPLGAMVCGRGNDSPFDAKCLPYISAFAAQVAAAWDVACSRRRWEEEIASRERHRVAQELHDHLAQELSGLVLAIESSQLALGQDLNAARAQLAKATRMARGCLSDVRQYMTVLRSSRDEVSSISTMLERLAEDFRRQTGISIDSNVAAIEKKLAPEVQQAFLRIAQEALTNVRKHANATCVRLEFSQEDGEGRLLLVDNGTGFQVREVAERAPGEGKYGLLGMNERATTVGGSFNISSAPNEGTRIDVRIPLTRTIPESWQAGASNSGEKRLTGGT